MPEQPAEAHWAVEFTGLTVRHPSAVHRIRDMEGGVHEFEFHMGKATAVPEALARRFAAIDCNGRKPGPFIVRAKAGEEPYVPRVVKQSDDAGNQISLAPGQVIAQLEELTAEALKARYLKLGLPAADMPKSKGALLQVVQDNGFREVDDQDDLIDDEDDEDPDGINDD